MDHDFATPPLRVEPVTLEGDRVRLEPLEADRLDELWEVAREPSLWRWIPFPVRTRDDLRTYVEVALAGRAAGTTLPFVTVERASGRVVGSSRFGNITAADYRTEIGWTWVGVPWQRSAINSEAKLLMLDHAFGTWRCHRVEFKTDSLNEQSRAGLLGIGATFEGIFRNHVLTHTGRMRHSAWYSITDDDWPEVRARLVARIAAGGREGVAPPGD
ncbi:MAG: GNAT family N-acetyltransferase [Candidatus Limnocylindrales bacterium]